MENRLGKRLSPKLQNFHTRAPISMHIQAIHALPDDMAQSLDRPNFNGGPTFQKLELQMILETDTTAKRYMAQVTSPMV